MNDRTLNKLQMVRDRHKFDFSDMPLCDLCGVNKGTQMHERIKRSQTTGNQEARELSYQVTLCNLLCPICHEKADTQEVDDKLWMFSIKLYGIMKVLAAFNALQQVMRRRLLIPEVLQDEIEKYELTDGR